MVSCDIGIYFVCCFVLLNQYLGIIMYGPGWQRNQCKECRGISICEHLQLQVTCKECQGNCICEHLRNQQHCNHCKDSIKGPVHENEVEACVPILYNLEDASSSAPILYSLDDASSSAPILLTLDEASSCVLMLLKQGKHKDSAECGEKRFKNETWRIAKGTRRASAGAGSTGKYSIQ